MDKTLPINHQTVTVNGSKWRERDPWNGLDFTKAEVREQSSLWLVLVGPSKAPPDHHLFVPWCHPADQPEGWEDGCMYRVRPRKKGYRFIRIGDEWRLSRAPTSPS